MLLQCLMLGVKIGKLNKDNHYGSMSPFPTDFTVFGSCPEQSSVLENIYCWHYSFFQRKKPEHFTCFFFIDVIIYFNVVLVLFSNRFMMNLKLQNAEQRRCLCARCMYMMQTTTTNFKAFR